MAKTTKTDEEIKKEQAAEAARQEQLRQEQLRQEEQRRIQIQNRKNTLNQEINELKQKKQQYDNLCQNLEKIVNKLTKAKSYVTETEDDIDRYYKSESSVFKNKYKLISELPNKIQNIISSINTAKSDASSKLVQISYQISTREYELSHLG